MTDDRHDDENAEMASLVLPFDCDTRDFARGVQVGMVWARTEPGTVLVYADTAEMLARVLDVRPGAFTVDDAGDEWLAVTFP